MFLYEKKFQDTKGAPEVANRRRTDNTMAKNRQEDKQQSSKHYTEN